MANRIQIRRGSGAPTVTNDNSSKLLPYELGWDQTNNALYINSNGTREKVGGRGLFLPLTGGTLSGTLHFKNITTSNYTEGIRLHPSSGGWNAIVFCGTDNTGDSGTSANTWGLFTNAGNFYISKNGSNNAATYLQNVNNAWSLGGPITMNDNLTFSGSAGIYYQGTKASYRMIRFIDNVSDNYGNGISIGGGGQTIIGGGESADVMVAQAGTAGAEVMWIANDGEIAFYPGQQNGFDGSAKITITAGSIFVGVNGNTTRENRVGVQSGAGSIYLYSHAATTGTRGIYALAHGTGGARSIILVGTNNEVYFADGYSGAATRLAYSQSALAASAITYLTCWNGYELRAITKAEMANAVSTGYGGIPLLRYAWWSSGNGNNVDSLRSGTTFAYTNHNAPTVGTIVAFDCSTNTNYTLQIMGSYNQYNLFYRNRNGSTWMAWQGVVHSDLPRRIFVTTSASVPSGAVGGDIVLVKA